MCENTVAVLCMVLLRRVRLDLSGELCVQVIVLACVRGDLYLFVLYAYLNIRF